MDIPADLRWNQRHIRDEIVKGILTGDSIPDIARRLQNVSDMDYRAAVRNARTATTGAQNAGRVHRYQQAEKMGIHLQKKWLATLDNRTRHEHRLLDGQTCPNGKKFRVEGMEIAYPGDPTAPGRLVYNCRCTLIADIEGVDGTVKKRHNRLNGKSYEQWKHELAPQNDVASGKSTGIIKGNAIKKNVLGCKAIQLPKKEYAHVMSELETWMTPEERKMVIVSKRIGNYYYKFVNDGISYKCIEKKPIVPEWEEV